jgi:hypothetical protein
MEPSVIVWSLVADADLVRPIFSVCPDSGGGMTMFDEVYTGNCEEGVVILSGM